MVFRDARRHCARDQRQRPDKSDGKQRVTRNVQHSRKHSGCCAPLQLGHDLGAEWNRAGAKKQQKRNKVASLQVRGANDGLLILKVVPREFDLLPDARCAFPGRFHAETLPEAFSLRHRVAITRNGAFAWDRRGWRGERECSTRPAPLQLTVRSRLRRLPRPSAQRRTASWLSIA